MHPVGFIIRIYHDARSPERQKSKRVLIGTVHLVERNRFFLIMKKINGFAKPRPTFLLPYIRVSSVGSFTASQKSGERYFSHVNHHTIFSHTQGQSDDEKPQKPFEL